MPDIPWGTQQPTDEQVQPRYVKAVEMIGRTGAISFRTGYSDEEDGDPVVWYAVAAYKDGKAEAAAALNPHDAVMRLCEQIIDGGLCRHCNRTTSFCADETDTASLDRAGLCVYSWDAQTQTYRRSCSGYRGAHGLGPKTAARGVTVHPDSGDG